MVQRRKCLDAPVDRNTDVPQRFVSFQHPAYPSFANELLSLPATEYEPVCGIDYHVALVACGIVACNKWNQAWFGQKYEDGDNNSDNNNDINDDSKYRRMPFSENEVLPYKRSPYYFFVNEDVTYKYPVIPSFEHWPFPHGNLPTEWCSLSFLSSTGSGVRLSEDS
ncbi:hypothetical protein GGR55DRAFT_600166 [Xylaria sp. FL0064]|nr:hypothetical protein GGR55DRAFT_600166 [Xylaria sp. FL0064]